MLLLYFPYFLELDEPWVDALLTVERDMRGDRGLCCLAYLMHSQRLQELDTECKRFKKLLQRQLDEMDDDDWTVLTWLCWRNP